jgi:hypothetical protein
VRQYPLRALDGFDINSENAAEEVAVAMTATDSRSPYVEK